MNPWEIYDVLIEGIPQGITVKDYQSAYNWTGVCSSEGSVGLAMTVGIATRPAVATLECLDGLSLREVGQLAKSWNFVEASIGVAAINSWYNHPMRVTTCGVCHPSEAGREEAFAAYFDEIQGKRVAVVGHFPAIERRLSDCCTLSILERAPSKGDFPDSACEYLLPEQEYVFITGSTLVNKTLPRLLALSRNAKVVLVGPSTPMASELFAYGVFGLSGFSVQDGLAAQRALRAGNRKALFASGVVWNRVRAESNAKD